MDDLLREFVGETLEMMEAVAGDLVAWEADPSNRSGIDRIFRTIQRMQERMNELGVRFRPHVKTSKCLPVVNAQLEAGAQGITVSTLKEAEQFFAAQIEANKLVQYTHLSDWQFQGKAPDDPRPDLVQQIRPRLDELQKRLLQQLADFTPLRTDPKCRQWLAEAVHEPLNDPLRQLAMIRATAELCIYKN